MGERYFSPAPVSCSRGTHAYPDPFCNRSTRRQKACKFSSISARAKTAERHYPVLPPRRDKCKSVSGTHKKNAFLNLICQHNDTWHSFVASEPASAVQLETHARWTLSLGSISFSLFFYTPSVFRHFRWMRESEGKRFWRLTVRSFGVSRSLIVSCCGMMEF